MIHGYQDNCRFCAHYFENHTCKAFPDGIPEPLWTGENLHREPYPGDQGILYASRKMPFPNVELPGQNRP